MSEIGRLLAELPKVIRPDAMAVPAFTLSWPGTGTATVELAHETLLLTSVDGGPTGTVSVAGRLGDVVPALESLGFTAVLADPAAAVLPANLLIDEGARDVTAGGIVFFRWTNPLWRLLVPAAVALRARAANIDAGIRQLDLLDAATDFADFWGTFTGIPRRAGEDDPLYTARQLLEVLRHRENNEALAALIEHDTGHVVIEVRDLRRDVFRCSATPLRGHPLPGWRYNAAVAEIRLADFGDALVEYAVRNNIAAGVTAFIQGQLSARVTVSLTVRVRGAQVGSPPAFVVGTTAVGVGSVGVGT
jgi:hypothetical protein